MPAAAALVSSARDVPLHSLKQSKAVAGSAPFLEGHAPFQHTLPVEVFGEAAFPGVYHLSQPTVDLDVALATLSTWAESGELKKQLVAHGGALLLRGLPLPTPNEFSQAMFASKVGTVPHVEVGRPPKRTVSQSLSPPSAFRIGSDCLFLQVLAPAVSTANEGPAWAPIWTCVGLSFARATAAKEFSRQSLRIWVVERPPGLYRLLWVGTGAGRRRDPDQLGRRSCSTPEGAGSALLQGTIREGHPLLVPLHRRQRRHFEQRIVDPHGLWVLSQRSPLSHSSRTR